MQSRKHICRRVEGFQQAAGMRKGAGKKRGRPVRHDSIPPVVSAPGVRSLA